MATRFRVESAFTVDVRGVFVVVGDVVEGTLKAGMVTEIDMASSGTTEFTVSSLTVMRRQGGGALVGVVFHSEDPALMKLATEHVLPNVMLDFR